MQTLSLNSDVVRELLEEPIIGLLLSLCCRSGSSNTRSTTDREILPHRLAKYCEPTLAINLLPLTISHWAAYFSRIDILSQLYEKHRSKFDEWQFLLGTGRGGSIDVIKWGRSRGIDMFFSDVHLEAARRGHGEMLKYLRSIGCTFGKNRFTQAARRGYGEMLKYLGGTGYTYTSEQSRFTQAARRGYREMRGYKRRDYCIEEGNVFTKAARGGHIDVLEWAKEIFKEDNRPCPYDRNITASAAAGGHLATLKWLRNEQIHGGPDYVFPWDGLTCEKAARAGHIHILEWVRDVKVHGDVNRLCSWNRLHVIVVNVCQAAVEDGQFEALKWLRDINVHGSREMICPWYPWDETIPEIAIKTNRVDILEWCLDNGCDHDDYLYAEAASCGHIDMIRWLALSRGHVMDDDALIYAIQLRQWNVLKWLCRPDSGIPRCSWSPFVCENVAFWGDLEMLKWLRDASVHTDVGPCPWDHKTCISAVRRGKIDILKWAIENGCDYDYVKCMRLVTKCSQDEIAQWLKERGPASANE
jgi:hypothetical protein